PPYVFTGNTRGAPNGVYNLLAKAYDFSGNTSTSSVNFYISNGDTVPPNVAMTAPTPGSVVSGFINISASAFDNVLVSSVQFSLDGRLIFTSTAPPYGFRGNSQLVSNGAHTLSAKAIDYSGNSSVGTVSFF